MIVAPDRVRDRHVGVVGADGEVVERVPARADEDEVVGRTDRKLAGRG
jgi:hypothetical protein